MWIIKDDDEFEGGCNLNRSATRLIIYKRAGGIAIIDRGDVSLSIMGIRRCSSEVSALAGDVKCIVDFDEYTMVCNLNRS